MRTLFQRLFEGLYNLVNAAHRWKQFAIHLNQRSSDQSWVLDHQLNELVFRKTSASQAKFLEGRTGPGELVRWKPLAE